MDDGLSSIVKNLRPKFGQTLGVGQRKGHDVFGVDGAQPAVRGGALTKRDGIIVANRARRPKQQWHRVPRVALELAGCAVIAGDDQHIWFEFEQFWQGRVHFFNHGFFGLQTRLFLGLR